MPPVRAFALLMLVVACNDSPRYQLDGLTVRTEDFDEVCAGSFGYFERRLAWLERETGLPHELVTFYWYLNGPHKECPADTDCSRGRSIWGEWNSFSHELVHAHLDRLGRPRVWLSEGMAEMLEDNWVGPVNDYDTPSDLMQVEDALELDYWNAAGFTAYLRDRYGMAQLLEYYRASADTGPDTATRIFGEVFGDDFAEVEAEYLALDIVPRTGSPTCDAREVVWTGETWQHDFILSCDEPDSLGPQQTWNDDDPDNGPGLFSDVTITIPPGPVEFNLVATKPVWVSITGCDQPEFVNLSPDELQAGADLIGGKYLVSVQSYLDPVATATLTAYRVPDDAIKARSNIASQSPLGPRRGHAHPCQARRVAESG
jgi:hypothetical protein